jgi:hypothetical protein
MGWPRGGLWMGLETLDIPLASQGLMAPP